MSENLADYLHRYRKPLSVLAALWFWTGVAVYARFLELPDLPEWLKQGYFWSSAAANAVWWGFVNPRLAKREELTSSVSDKEEGKIRQER